MGLIMDYKLFWGQCANAIFLRRVKNVLDNTIFTMVCKFFLRASDLIALFAGMEALERFRELR